MAGLTPLVSTLPDALLIGWKLGRWYAAGRRNAHLRFFAIAALILAGAVLCAIGESSGTMLLVCRFV